MFNKSNRDLKTENKQPLGLKINKIKYIKIFSVLLVILSITSLLTGSYDISTNKRGLEIFLISRVSRTLAIILTAVAMSVSGLVMQIITRNKMVEPTTTGTLEWAGLGLIFISVLLPSPTVFQRTISAIFFSFIGTIIFFFLIRRVKLKSSVIVPIIGIMYGAIVSSISTFIGLTLNMTQILGVWFSGSFSTIESGRYELLWIIILVTIAIYKFADKLTVAGLGEDISISLGINYDKIIVIATLLISMTIGIVASVIGYIPFLGLIVPNIVSKYFGDDLRTNLPIVALIGAIILLACDVLARIIIMPFEVPVSLIMGTLGAAIFIFLLLNRKVIK